MELSYLDETVAVLLSLGKIDVLRPDGARTSYSFPRDVKLLTSEGTSAFFLAKEEGFWPPPESRFDSSSEKTPLPQDGLYKLGLAEGAITYMGFSEEN
jgi:hypothetical protein